MTGTVLQVHPNVPAELGSQEVDLPWTKVVVNRQFPIREELVNKISRTQGGKWR